MSSLHFQIENTWAIHSNTDIREVIIQRFNIPLTWLDMKRVQYPLNPADQQFINGKLNSNETFEAGWLNDEVKGRNEQFL